MVYTLPSHQRRKYLIAALLACYCVVGLPISFAQTVSTQPATPSNQDNTQMPIPLIPDNVSIIPPAQEEHTTAVTLPPAPKQQEPGLSEDTIHQHFDESHPALSKARQLPPDTKQALDAITKRWMDERQARQTQSPIVLERGNFPSASIDSTLKQQQQPQEPSQVKALGITLSKKSEKKTPTVENLQEQAYNALMAGQVEAAISLYKQSLQLSPDNRLSMFGLATTYHRNGQITQARQLYSEILSKFPNDRDTLNNFLALISEAAPQDAFFELQRLEDANPQFSPIAAQIGMLYQRMGNNDKAIQYLKKAITLSPENLSYRYNLAILFDRLGRWQEAAMLYRQLISAAREGVAIPGDSQKIEDRLMFITKSSIEG